MTAQPWFFAFTPKTDRPWLKRLPFQFRHCLAVTTFGPCTFMIDPLWRNVNYGFTNEAPLVKTLVELRKGGHEILFLEWEPDLNARPKRSPIMTCASIIAYTCGIPTRALTPDGLYSAIIKLGGEKLK
jgi:hypothetical protein